jgi:lipoate-protein ligase A
VKAEVVFFLFIIPKEKQMRVRLITQDANTPPMNMAIDEALLISELPVLRLYRWNPPGLSIGYAQSVKEINTTFCTENNIALVRRITGGSAVLHEHELTYSVIMGEEFLSRSVLLSARKISEGIMRALELLGISASRQTAPARTMRTAACFDEPSWYEILVNGRKIVGSAQRRVRGKVLQHGVLLISIDVVRYARCFTSDETLAHRLLGRMTSISENLGRPVSYGEIAGALKKGFAAMLGMEFFEDELTPDEINLAKRLHDSKYAQDEWNLMR